MAHAYVTVIFNDGLASETTITAPMPGYRIDAPRAQTVGQNAAGEWYFYDKGVRTIVALYEFELTAAQKATLDTFFHTTCVGGTNTFTFRDHLRKAFAGCRFKNAPDFGYTKLRSGRFRCQLEIILPTLPG